jgi:MOSC domain-containing protein YiiM
MTDRVASHRSLPELEQGLGALGDAPRNAGHVALIVRRPEPNRRETPERATLSPEAGLEGDGWSSLPPRDPEAQITLIRRDVAELIAAGQPLPLFGDNLVVDLDLSDANLPAGSRLRVGEALVEVTPLPHDGCRKFAERFGLDALRFVQAKPTRDRNLRGIHVRVVEGGALERGAPISVVSRA